MSRLTHRHPTQEPFRIQGYHLLWPDFPDRFPKVHELVMDWAAPRSLATTRGISVDFFSSGYLDVSVPRVSPPHPMYSDADTAEAVGFPIRKSSDQSLFAGSPKLIAGYNVLHRLLSPRHPPYALIHLTI